MALETRSIYCRRFGEDLEFRQHMWKVLCEHYFQQFIPTDSVVMELAAGYCEFINNINARQKIAIDINEDTIRRANKDIQVVLTTSSDLSRIESESIDRIFVSNFFEHITKDHIVQTVKECHRCLKKGGKLLILQPNIRFIYKDYWMFFDHLTPLDDRSLCEVLEISGFEVEVCIPQFLPYTTKSSLPKSLLLAKIYINFPPLHKLFGQQAFIVARKRKK